MRKGKDFFLPAQSWNDDVTKLKGLSFKCDIISVMQAVLNANHRLIGRLTIRNAFQHSFNSIYYKTSNV